MSEGGARVVHVEAIAWSAIGLLAATLLGVLFFIGSRIDGLGARIDGLGSRVDGLSARIDADVDQHAR